jgi:carbon storage regulator
MLVLSRKKSQKIVIGQDIRITVVKIERSHVRLGIDAPAGVVVLREELLGPPGDDRSHAAAHADQRPVSTSEPDISRQSWSRP